jgi:uncharacterized membrane protein (DUF4010 family)
MSEWIQYFPSETAKISLTFLLSFLVGLEREEHKHDGPGTYVFGGVRAYPLIGLLGYALAKIPGDSQIFLAAGFIVLGGFLGLSYWKKLRSGTDAGLTSELSGLYTFAVGVLVYKEDYWVATTLVVMAVFLLELKKGLEGVATKIPAEEVYTFTKFLLMTAVILPVVPNHDFTPYLLNPFKICLVVVVISGISYVAYVLDKWVGERGGVLVSAFLGGTYSSTITTLVLSRRTRNENRPRLFSGSILIASGMMYFRLITLLGLLSPAVAVLLAPVFLILGALAVIVGFFWAKSEKGESVQKPETTKRNPLEIRSAIIFGLLFLVMAVLIKVAEEHLGSSGVYGLAFLSGLADVDPFIMSISQSGSQTTTLLSVATAILIATCSNNLLKAVYSFWTARGPARLQSVLFLAGLAILGLASFAIL